jgi:hypothetical protein
MLGDGTEPLHRDPPTARDVLQERHHLVGSFRPAEREQQDGVVRGERRASRVRGRY